MAMKLVTTASGRQINVQYDSHERVYTLTDKNGVDYEVRSDWCAILWDKDLWDKVGIDGTCLDLLKYIKDTSKRKPDWLRELTYLLTDDGLSPSNYFEDIKSRLVTEGCLWDWAIDYRSTLGPLDASVLLSETTEQEVTPRCSLHTFQVYAPEGATTGGSGQWDQVYNYSYKMNATEFDFFRSERKTTEEIFFGLELELSSKVPFDELQRIVTEVEPKQDPFFIAKSDSTITGRFNHKYELVTVPCSPRYLRKQFTILFSKLEALCAAKNLSFEQVFDVSGDLNNGIHIHIGRDHFFGGGRRGYHVKRFASMFALDDKSTREMFNKVARRVSLDGEYHGLSRDFKGRSTPWKLKNCISDSHRHARVNMKNSATVEVRMYQGIVDLQHILRCIDFTEAMFEYSAVAPISVLTRWFSTHFEKYLANTPRHKYRPLKGLFS